MWICRETKHFHQRTLTVTEGLRKTNRRWWSHAQQWEWQGRRGSCGELEMGCWTLRFSRNLLLSAARRETTLQAQLLFFRLQPAMKGFSAEDRGQKSMRWKCKAMNYYCRWMTGDEYEPRGILCVSVLSIPAGLERGQVQEKTQYLDWGEGCWGRVGINTFGCIHSCHAHLVQQGCL